MHIMSCCLMAPSNYLEQRWLIVSNAVFTSQRMHNVFVFIIEFEFHRLRIRIRNIYCSNVTKIYRGICVEKIKIYMTNTKILTLSIRVGLSHSLHLHMYTNTHTRAKTDSTQITHTHTRDTKQRLKFHDVHYWDGQIETGNSRWHTWFFFTISWSILLADIRVKNIIVSVIKKASEWWYA